MKFYNHLNPHILLLRLRLKKAQTRPTLHYAFKFTSIISPGSLKNLTLSQRPRARRSNNLYVKQSYVLLTWMAYIRETQAAAAPKSLTDGQGVDGAPVPSFFIYPKKKTKFTLLKAPMAHKTFSQEQFISQFYQLSISFNNDFRSRAVLNSANNLLFLSLYIRSNQLPVETNLFFLKRLRVSLTGKDPLFMSLR
jgi:hypothetical protein